jgi:hypoxanthine phosphoribosyltransferase
MSDLPAGVDTLVERSDVIVSAEAVIHAIDQLAVRMTLAFADANPVVICVLHGGLPFTGALMNRLHFPLQLGFLQVARYGDTTTGGDLEWLVEPSVPVGGRSVVVLDDVLDAGETLVAVVDRLKSMGASDVHTAVLVDKAVPGRSYHADFTALTCPDRYLFGWGMDYQGYWRNLDAIYALKDEL